ncbi:MAG: hypothetical protein K9N23_04925 [Akkermansiaceae bacterium]|nr:hypothetical protein [Akkermansiaceae bacterium]MCF7731004.1 hypothetical protein [Akkermansiaceae bacterium]
MSNPIPDFDHNLVLPPHVGSPANRNQLSPYPCTTIDLCEKLGNSLERRAILGNFLDFRERLRSTGLTNGFQWLDGSFLEDVETRLGRPPADLDVVTVYWGYDMTFQSTVLAAFPEFASPRLAKEAFSIDHYPFDAGFAPERTVEFSRYWALLFSHNRLGVWKGMLKIDLDTPVDDTAARNLITPAAP